MNDKIKLAEAKQKNLDMLAKQKSLEHIVVKKDRILFNAFRLTKPPILEKKPPYNAEYRQAVRDAFEAYQEVLEKMKPRISYLG